MARAGKWELRAGAAGWGSYADMITTMESAIEGRDVVLGKELSMADVIFGGTIPFRSPCEQAGVVRWPRVRL